VSPQLLAITRSCGLFASKLVFADKRCDATKGDPVCHEASRKSQREGAARRPFLSSPYTADESDRMTPSERIDQCPWASGGESCKIRKHDWRQRKSGPSIELRILRCLTHGHDFTVYPPGYVPYGRQVLVPVDLHGHLLSQLEQAEGSFRGCGFRSRGGGKSGQALA